ncbi:MAG: DoxX family protein [Alloacidobacterium sp.]|jgi:thiosulfate dehydrogenase [quinone] large subunit
MTFQVPENGRDISLAYLLVRATLGINVLTHGVVRILSGPEHFASMLGQAFYATPLPQWLVVCFGYSLPWIEAVIGIFVLFGLFTRFFLAAGALLILVLTVGAGLRQDWDITGLQLIYAAVYAMLIAFSSANHYSIDSLYERITTAPCLMPITGRKNTTPPLIKLHPEGAINRGRKVTIE